MKTVVISLARTPERWELFKRHNDHLEVERFDAWDGRREDRVALVQMGYIVKGLDYTDGAIGCALSHITLWRRAVAENQPLLILEDDALVHKDFARLAKDALSKLPAGWDMLTWGWNLDCPAQLELLPGIAAAQLVISDKFLQTKPDQFQKSRVTPSAYPLQWCFGTPGYAVSPLGAAKLLQQLLPLRNFTMTVNAGTAKNTGIDVAMCSAYSKLAAYACVPPLIVSPNDKETSTVSVFTPEKAVA